MPGLDGLNPDFLAGSILFTIIFLVVGFAIQVYSIWLNWKQSKVRDQMSELLEEVRKIREKL